MSDEGQNGRERFVGQHCPNPECDCGGGWIPDATFSHIYNETAQAWQVVGHRISTDEDWVVCTVNDTRETEDCAKTIAIALTNQIQWECVGANLRAEAQRRWEAGQN